MIDPAYVACACVFMILVAVLLVAWWVADRLSG